MIRTPSYKLRLILLGFGKIYVYKVVLDSVRLDEERDLEVLELPREKRLSVRCRNRACGL